MTALPRATSTGSCSSTESELSRDYPPSEPTEPARARDGDSGKEEHDFFEDVGYYALLKDFSESDADPELSDDFANLKESVERCEILQQSVKELNADLMQAQKQTKLSTIEDVKKQKESDEKIENIRKMEEDAKRMRDSVPKKNERIIQIEAENSALKNTITEESGWTEAERKEKSSLEDAIDRGRSEAAEKKSLLSNLSSQLQVAETEVGASITRRDQAIAALESLNNAEDLASEKVIAAEQRVNEAERSLCVLRCSLEGANKELIELKAEREREKEMADHSMQEVKHFQSVQEACVREHKELLKVEEDTLRQLKKIKDENTEIDATSNNLQKELSVLSKQREDLFEERAQLNRERKSINEQITTVERERQDCQEEANKLSILVTKIENDIPLAQRESEALKRELKRQEHLLGLIGRKIGINDRSCKHLFDLSKSNETALLASNATLLSSKRLVTELEKARKFIVLEQKQDQERLIQASDILQVRYMLCLLCWSNSDRLVYTLTTDSTLLCCFFTKEKADVFEIPGNFESIAWLRCHRSRTDGDRSTQDM